MNGTSILVERLYASSCIDMQADEVLIFGMTRRQQAVLADKADLCRANSSPGFSERFQPGIDRPNMAGA